MLKNIHVEHYKAFDIANVPIKPITILLGANSVGKSSIIHLLLAMEQTAMVDSENYTSCLKLFGGAVNLGSAKNIFRRFDTSKHIGLSFTICDSKLKETFNDIFDEWLNFHYRRIMMYGFDYNFNEENVPARNLFEKLRRQRLKYYPNLTREEYLSIIKSVQKNIKKIKTERQYDDLLNVIIKNDISKWEKLYDLLLGLKNIDSSDFEYNLKIKFENESTLIVVGFSLNCENKVIFSYDDIGNDVIVSSDFMEFDDKESKKIKNLFNGRSTLFSCFRDTKSKGDELFQDIVSFHVLKIINDALKSLRNAFRMPMINHVSPLRANPKRYYMLDKANVTYSLDTFDGDAMAEVLKENNEIRKKVNLWLDKFKLSVDVFAIKEIIHHLKVNQNGLPLDITDVGFGISQVLPIIIQGFLSKNDSLTIIEQPEIHLHPKMQADLADLFIDMVNSNDKKNVIIETHSEYLLRRLRRRISEGEIKSDEVSICLFHPQTDDKGAIIESLVIEEKGEFKWPEDFYVGELSKDTTEFIKNQN